MTTRWVIGLSAGSSADGLDTALMELEGAGLNLAGKLVRAFHLPFGDEMRRLAQRAVDESGPPREIARLHRLLGETFAAAARQAADGASLSLQKVQCIGCSGHSVWDDPEGRFPALLNLGMAAVVAERTGVTTVSDFRSRDVAAGGQGGTLTTLPDYLLFRAYHPAEARILVHLGTATEIVCLPAQCRVQDITGFEAGPCNLLLDGLMRQLSGGQEEFDSGGKHAVQGRCIEPLLQIWLAHPFLQRRPPKMLPRHVFGDPFIAQVMNEMRRQQWNPLDVLCTATQFIAYSIARAIHRFLPVQHLDATRILLSGGGTRNGLLRRLLEQQLHGAICLQDLDAAGVPWHARKAVVAAVLAALTMDGVPANLPQATGAAGSRLLGSVAPGSALNWARCLTWMANHFPSPRDAD
jgi:anhydro-N-acetylmuramic acid kinase